MKSVHIIASGIMVSSACLAGAATVVKLDKEAKTIVIEVDASELVGLRTGASVQLTDAKEREYAAVVKAIKRDRILLSASGATARLKPSDRVTVAQLAAETDEFGFEKDSDSSSFSSPAPSNAESAPAKSPAEAQSRAGLDLVKTSPSPAKDMREPLSAGPAVTMLRSDTSSAGAALSKLESKIEISSASASSTLKEDGHRALIAGQLVAKNGLRIGARIEQEKASLSLPGIDEDSDRSSQDISFMMAGALSRNLGIGLELLIADRDDDEASENYMRLLPSVAWMERDYEIVGSWRTPIHVEDEDGDIYEAGYLRVDGVYKLSRGLHAIGQLTRNFVSNLGDDLDDTFGLKGGMRVSSDNYSLGGQVTWRQSPGDDASSLERSAYGGYGVSLDGTALIGKGHELGALLEYDNLSASSKGDEEDLDIKIADLDIGLSYKRSF